MQETYCPFLWPHWCPDLGCMCITVSLNPKLLPWLWLPEGQACVCLSPICSSRPPGICLSRGVRRMGCQAQDECHRDPRDKIREGFPEVLVWHQLMWWSGAAFPGRKALPEAVRREEWEALEEA